MSESLDELLRALEAVDRVGSGELLAVARTHDRVPLGEALWRSFVDAPDESAREHRAWLLKQLASPTSWAEIARAATGPSLPAQTRRYLVEALDRLAFARDVGWGELGATARALLSEPDAGLREAAVGVVVSLPLASETTALLERACRDEDAQVVLAALNGLEQKRLDVSVIAAALESDPRPGVQKRAAQILARRRRRPN